MFECLERERYATEAFIQADETIKRGLLTKQYEEAVYGLRELVGFISILAKENVPGRHEAICPELRSKEANWTDLERIAFELHTSDTDLVFEDGRVVFNRHDITQETEDIAQKYIKNEWYALGYTFGRTLDDNSKKEGEGNEEKLGLY